MIADVKKVTVSYNDRIVGYLAQLDEKTIGFQYDDEWLKNGFSISPLSLPLRKEIFVSKSKHFDGLYGVFWDSLPDGWGELLVKRFLAKQGVNYDRLSPLTKLSLIGENGLGGFSYQPSQYEDGNRGLLDFDTLAREVEKILNDENADDLDAVYRLGGSSGGARPKAHVRIDGEEWIVKFPCRIDPKNVGELEYKANVTARECGISVNEFFLFPSNLCSGYFGVKRFDRSDGKRIHMISLAAVLETTHRVPNLDYGYLLRVIERICGDKDDMYEAFRRMCFNVYYGNKDDHSKNFAFLYDGKRGSYRLSPAYDLTRTPDKLEHEMTVNRSGNPTDADMLALAEDFKLNMHKCRTIMNNVKVHCLKK